MLFPTECQGQRRDGRTCRSRFLEWLEFRATSTKELLQVRNASRNEVERLECVAELFRKATKRQVMLGAALVDEKGNLRPSTPTNAAPLMPPLMMPSITPPSHSLLQFVRALPINLTHTLLSRSGNTSLSSTPAPNPSGSYGKVSVRGEREVRKMSVGGLVSSSQVTPLQTSTPLLFPQGSYGTSQPMSESSDVAQASTGARPSSLGATDQKSHQLSGRVGQSVTPFVLSQPSLASGMLHFPLHEAISSRQISAGTSLQAPSGKSQFVWKNEELSMVGSPCRKCEVMHEV